MLLSCIFKAFVLIKHKDAVKKNREITRNSVSDVLRQFVRKKLAVCLTLKRKRQDI